MPIDHVTITAADLAVSLVFYDAALGPLGLVRVIELVDEEEDDAPIEAVGYGDGDVPVLWVVAGDSATQLLHIALAAPSAEAVTAFHAAALASGGTSHDRPRRWPIFRRGTFNAIVRDPDGNLVEAVGDEALTGP